MLIFYDSEHEVFIKEALSYIVEVCFSCWKTPPSFEYVIEGGDLILQCTHEFSHDVWPIVTSFIDGYLLGKGVDLGDVLDDVEDD